MAHLTDMEELLATIPKIETRDYMREAMNCYMASAYRGAVVLSYIALFDDLLAKLGELAAVNSTAKIIHTEATGKKDNQDVYENYLIDQLSSKQLISGLDTLFLSILRNLRNKSAHPSGHNPSPEEARYVFFETINRFLSKPVLSATLLIDKLVARLINTNFFPSRTLDEVSNVVRDELSALHDEAMPKLVAKLVYLVASSDTTTSKNSSAFLIGLAQLDKPSSNQAIQTILITSNADDATYKKVITETLSANGTIFNGLNDTTVSRIRSILAENISSITSSLAETSLSHPITTFMSLARSMSESEFVSTFKPELKELFSKRAHSAFLIELVSTKPSLQPDYQSALLSNAGSSDFTTSNIFSKSFEELDKPLSSLLSDEFTFMLFIAIMNAAKNGGWSAKAIVDTKFSAAPLLRTKALSHITGNRLTSLEYINTNHANYKDLDQFIERRLTDEEAD